MSHLLTTVSKRSTAQWSYPWRRNLARNQCRFFAEAKKPKYEIPQHMVRKGKRRIPEAYIRVLKQVPPRQHAGMNGIYIWQGYTLKDRLKKKGIIEGENDEKWTNLNKYTVN